MLKLQKRPETVEAYLYDGTMHCAADFADDFGMLVQVQDQGITLCTKKGDINLLHVEPGQWVVKAADGSLSVCNSDEIAAEYVPARRYPLPGLMSEANGNPLPEDALYKPHPFAGVDIKDCSFFDTDAALAFCRSEPDTATATEAADREEFADVIAALRRNAADGDRKRMYEGDDPIWKRPRRPGPLTMFGVVERLEALLAEMKEQG